MSSDDPLAPDGGIPSDPLADASSDGAEGVPDGSEPGPPTAQGSRGGALVPSDPLRRYLAEIRRYGPLSRDEERDLARRYRDTGDREALFRLVTANLMLVVRIALSFRRAARNVLDLIQEGNVGLLQAIDRFDPDVGVRLPTYAAWWIRAYIVKYLLDNVRQVRVGTTNARRKLLHNLRDEKRRLLEQGFEAGPRLLAERFGVSEDDVKDIEIALQARDVALDAPVGDDGESTRGESLKAQEPSVEEQVARREMQEKASAAISSFREKLGERDRAILDLRILSEEPLTLQALGDRFGTTREAVRQAEAKLMARLKEHLRRALGDLGSIRIGPE